MTSKETPISDFISYLTEVREQHGEIPVYIRDNERFYNSFRKDVRVLGSENCGLVTIQEDVAVGDKIENFVPTKEFLMPTKALLIN